jgi:hypothetical protein
MYYYQGGGRDNPGIPFIPHDPLPAPISGDRYLIRKKGHEDCYWYLDSEGRLVLCNKPTIFRIDLINNDD